MLKSIGAKAVMKYNSKHSIVLSNIFLTKTQNFQRNGAIYCSLSEVQRPAPAVDRTWLHPVVDYDDDGGDDYAAVDDKSRND